jgi:cytochrome oxidase Cu insertion factor (SCO1/SenC/PrrC family)
VDAATGVPRRTSWLRRGPGLVIAVAVAAVVVAAVAAGYAVVRVRQHQDAAAGLRVAGIPASVPTSLSNLMQLSPVPVQGAPGFTLTDQGGHVVSLASLRGRVVVLEFMDPHCTDICPIVSQEFIDAYRDLGAKAARVAFVAVNVNRYHLGVADVAAFSSEQRLAQVPSWHFLTGTYPSLAAVWKDYEIAVDAPGPDADVVHSSQMYFIDPQGRERFMAEPMADHTASGSAYLPAGQLASWGQGIALMARQLVS